MNKEYALLTNAKLNKVHEKVKAAQDKVQSIERSEVERLVLPEVNALLQQVKKLLKEVDRVKAMVKSVKVVQDNA